MNDPSTPHAGYLAHGFARFRKERLETQRLERAKAAIRREFEEAGADDSKAGETSDDGMFFGTSSIKRRVLRASNRSERESHEVLKARTRRRRRPAPPLPTRDRDPGPRQTPPHGTGIDRRGRPRRAG